MQPKRYEIVVGNIGTVYDGHDAKLAEIHYQAYTDASQHPRGRASGENVTMLVDMSISKVYIGGPSDEATELPQDRYGEEQMQAAASSQEQPASEFIAKIRPGTGESFNGQDVYISPDQSTLYIRIPLQHQLPIDGGCDCPFCKANPLFAPQWDVLALSARATSDGGERCWTVHFPRMEACCDRWRAMPQDKPRIHPSR